MQAGLKGGRISGHYAPYSKVAEVECVVIAVRYTDDALNVSKTHVEYDVKDLRTGQIYPNARKLETTQGMMDGEENILNQAQRLIGATKPTFDPKTDQLSQSDGDFVLVSFTYGAQHGPVITGVLPHPKMAYGTKRAQGVRKFQTHKGTSIEIQSNGSYVITRGKTTITVDADANIEVVHKTGSKMTFLESGDVNLVPAGDLLLGNDRAILAMARETDPVASTIAPGLVLVLDPISGLPVPNPEPIPVTGEIVSGSLNVKG